MHCTCRVWSTAHTVDTGSGIYENGKNTGWLYDVDGRLTDFGATYYHYDAAGQVINTGSDAATGNVAQEQVFDGDSQRTKMHSQQVTYAANGTITTTNTTQYFVRSSVLNQVITELNESGQKTRTYVYQGGQVLAWQQQSGNTQTMAWEHRDASNASVRMPGGGLQSSAELEPQGSNAGTAAPLQTSPGDEPGRELTYPGFAAAVSSECRIDGMDMPCGLQQRLMEASVLGEKHTNLPFRNTLYGRRQPETAIVPLGLGLFSTVEFVRLYGKDSVHWHDLVFLAHEQQLPFAPLPEKVKNSLNAALSGLASRLKRDDVSPKCKELLNQLGTLPGFDLQKFISFLEGGANFYDGKQSSAPIADYLSPTYPAPKGVKTVAQFFKNRGEGYKAHANGNWNKPGFTVFFRPGYEGLGDGATPFNMSLLFHEALHAFGTTLNLTEEDHLRYADPGLQTTLGLQVGAPSHNITAEILKNCFGKK